MGARMAARAGRGSAALGNMEMHIAGRHLAVFGHNPGHPRDAETHLGKPPERVHLNVVERSPQGWRGSNPWDLRGRAGGFHLGCASFWHGEMLHSKIAWVVPSTLLH